MKRLTESGSEYRTSEWLRRLRDYENTGWQPNEITPKNGSVADRSSKSTGSTKKKHTVKLIKRETPDRKRNFYSFVFDGKDMGADELAKIIGVKPVTVRDWAKKGVFESKLKERGII